MGVCLIALAAMWALWPQPAPSPLALDSEQPNVERDELKHANSNDPEIDLGVDPGAFLAVLWHDPSPPEDETDEQQQPTRPEPEPLRVQLVAIIDDNGRRQAALYDERDDRIVVVADGEKLRDHDVRVTADAVEFIRDGRSQHLLLHPQRQQTRGGRS